MYKGFYTKFILHLVSYAKEENACAQKMVRDICCRYRSSVAELVLYAVNSNTQR